MTPPLSDYIKTKARELGFQKVGIAKAQSTPDSKKRLEMWLKAGHHATMVWMEKRKYERGDIHIYFPEAKSVVSVAMNYYSGENQDVVVRGEPAIRFSKYAWGEDYHRVLKKKLYRLLDSIRSRVKGLKGLVCVDTSPVMEKVWAQRAGLGWQGKNTNLISREYGSWLFLGELILDIPLDYDLPFNDDLCGTCSACIEACPTQALTAYQLDANKCISYLTIEHRGELPEEYHDQMKGWIFGCDICQDVCPWNFKFHQLSPEPAFRPRREIREWLLTEWQALDREVFLTLFDGSSVKRTKYSGLKRNIEAAAKSTPVGKQRSD